MKMEFSVSNTAKDFKGKREKYIEFRNDYKRIRNETLFCAVVLCVACLLLIGAGIYFGNIDCFIYAAMFALPLPVFFHYAIKSNKKIKHYDVLIACMNMELATAATEILKQAIRTTQEV